MSNPLIIVESPAKAKTIAGYLGDDYVVESSIGHIRDLPRGAADVPAAYKGESWARLGVDVDNDFKPLYVVSSEKKEQVRNLKALLKEADELYLATDEDREGEAIAWHLLEELSPKVPVRRMVFHEITPQAIQHAIDNPRDIDRRLVDAQEARRILDRLYGYEVSPVLWRKVLPKLSAGRVQSVATRIVVERERERMAFIRAGYWDLEGVFDKVAEVAAGEPKSLKAKLISLDGKRLASGKDFDDTGKVKAGLVVLDAGGSAQLVTDLDGADFAVRSVESRPYTRKPAAPFRTSTFQQEAGRKLRMSSQQAMRSAQSLYEQGYITYMRTDSTTLSETALSAARSEIVSRYGDKFLHDGPRLYDSKVKNAQEAHEAIRPAGDTFRSPDEISNEVNASDAKVYDLIWKRTVASQMNNALGTTSTIRLGAVARSGQDAEFSASGTVITHPGFQQAYVEDTDEAAEEADEERRLPALAEGDSLTGHDIEANGHETQPPARYTEASLVKRLEELGVGRPSTFASIMGTIQDRGYVWKKGSAMVPSFTAFAVVKVLEDHFPNLVDYAFTARMELDLDSIAGGDKEAVPWLSGFYFGDDVPGQPDSSDGSNGAAGSDAAIAPGASDAAAAYGLKVLVSERLDEIDPRLVNSIPLGDDSNGVPIVARVGKFGPYLQRGDDRAGIPDDLAPDELTIEKATELIDAPSGDRVLGLDPETGLDVSIKNGRFGTYVQLGEQEEGSKEKPKRSSIFADMTAEDVTLEQALELLTIPRLIGNDPADGQEIWAHNGKYGPYIKKEKDSRSIEGERLLLTMTVDEALKVLAEPKRRRGQAAPKPPLRELGADLVSGEKMIIKEGRFGEYVTDGETNASLRKGDTVENMTDERASELLQLRRERGPVKKKKKATKKKATKKKSTAKKATKKKSTAKKAAAKKKAPAKKAAPDADAGDATAEGDATS